MIIIFFINDKVISQSLIFAQKVTNGSVMLGKAIHQNEWAQDVLLGVSMGIKQQQLGCVHKQFSKLTKDKS